MQILKKYIRKSFSKRSLVFCFERVISRLSIRNETQQSIIEIEEYRNWIFSVFRSNE